MLCSRLWLFLALLLGLSNAGRAQVEEPSPSPRWPADGLAVQASTLVLISSLGVHYDRYWHREKVHWNVGTGAVLALNFWEPAWIGWQAVGGLWTGQGNHHLSLRVGAVWLFPATRYWNRVLFPLFQVGYRYQKPGRPHFWTADVGLRGIGIGYGRSLFP